jgi:hypothetical protein
VIGLAFSLGGGGGDGRAWAAAVARETLPRLATLELVPPLPGQRVHYVCRPWLTQRRRPFDLNRCPSCSAPYVCPAGREVERALWEALPAAAADAGRQLVVSDPQRTVKWHSRADLFFTLHFEAAPPEG